MRLKFQAFDGRSWNHIPVVDEDTGNEVGFVHSDGVGPYKVGGIRVSLFGGKYSAYLNRFDECRGFVMGVEAVLDHVVALTDVIDPAEAKAA